MDLIIEKESEDSTSKLIAEGLLPKEKRGGRKWMFGVIAIFIIAFASIFWNGMINENCRTICSYHGLEFTKYRVNYRNSSQELCECREYSEYTTYKMSKLPWKPEEIV